MVSTTGGGTRCKEEKTEEGEEELASHATLFMRGETDRKIDSDAENLDVENTHDD